MTTFLIKLSPQRRDDRLHLEKRGATLLFNGELFDPLAYDEKRPSCQWIVGRLEAIEDGWSVTVILPHGSPAPRATRFPEPITVSTDGPVELPPYEGPDEDHEELLIAVAAKLAEHKNLETTEDNYEIRVPKRLVLREMPKGVYFSEQTGPFAKFPEFGAVVAHVIGTVSLLDLEMLRTAVSQHGSESLLAIGTAFRMIKSDEQKAKYIRSFAKETGRPRVSETIEWAYRFSKPIYEIRNAFAHHIWGECPALPDALLLADPKDQLIGHAALSQLLGHRHADEEAQTLMRIVAGEGGSRLSEVDAQTIFKMVVSRQNSPSRIEAFNMIFNNPMGVYAPAAEVWTANDFRNALLAASIAQKHVVKRLQQVSQWLHGLLAEDELEPLPVKPLKSRRQ